MRNVFIRGLGSASYTPVEDELARELIAAGAHDEVKLLHDLKVRLDARAVEGDETWDVERERITAAHGTQGALL